MIDLRLGDCLEVMKTLEAGIIDAVITDPPYPGIKREYGYWTEAEWFDMMCPLVTEVRRVLKPTGSAVFILQPNSEKAGKMRLWLWRFMVWIGERWNIIQDVYWWNYTALPSGGVKSGLLRESAKNCIWVGDTNCYRNQRSVLWSESDWNKVARLNWRINKDTKASPSGHDVRRQKSMTRVVETGGVTPYNVLPFGNGGRHEAGGLFAHPAGTPLKLCDWWTRYICPPGGTVLDPFAGSGTTGIAALQNGCSYIGIEKYSKYYPIMQERIEAAQSQMVMAL
jgi:DNA modification methylase